MENDDVEMLGSESNEAVCNDFIPFAFVSSLHQFRFPLTLLHASMPIALQGLELDDMKKRLKEMEDEASALREMQAKVEKEMGSVQAPATAASSQNNKEEVDSRSVFVGNVDYSCTPEEVQQHFQSCGTVNRVTIRTDKFGQPKGYAYVEFLEVQAVQEALSLNESELHGRQLKVTAKRTNIPGMKQYRPRRPNPYQGFRGRAPYAPPFAYAPFGYGPFSMRERTVRPPI
ncbi:polyadenylate-binding protein 2 [Vigna unguiculata]|uniref:Polyadenylate-binding protein 2 n=1 Tax=Vigna unguiculata TaxID=3917 RepID=A0A4D6L6H4_VIGUN|nr:polyadenylate-binding protein 2 [Vigna unguiculata]